MKTGHPLAGRAKAASVARQAVISGEAEQAAASRAVVDRVFEYPSWKQASIYADDIADFLNETRPTEWKFAHHTGNLFIIVYR